MVRVDHLGEVPRPALVRRPFEPSPRPSLRRFGLLVPARMSYSWHKPMRRSREDRMINGIMGAGAGDRGVGDRAIVIYGSSSAKHGSIRSGRLRINPAIRAASGRNAL
jgi:hypothetical protein